jgi:protein gp37
VSFKSAIEWTESTWNPVTGCDKVSPGCLNCYAERFAQRWRGVKDHPYEQGFDIKLWESRINLPLTWKKPQIIFVNSMSDLFHKQVPVEFIQDVFQVMKQAHWHIFQLLTKRPERLIEIENSLEWSDNIWLGVSVENSNYVGRIDKLRMAEARTKFLSLEPLLGPLQDLNLRDIDWVIVGGESGPGARKMSEEWVIDIKNQCLEASVPFFFKQWGGVFKSKTGRVLEGRTWDEMPQFFKESKSKQEPFSKHSQPVATPLP